jgi:multidrug transporter EmrE-like cation transporter
VWYLILAIIAQTVALTLSKLAGESHVGYARFFSVEYFGVIAALGIQALVWQKALQKFPLSFAYPILSVVFILIPIVSFFLFREEVTIFQVGGSVLICIGTIYIRPLKDEILE